MTNESMQVLVVEDSPSDFLLVRKMLDAAVHRRMTVEQAETLAQALSVVTRQPPVDAALLDLGLPDSDALETFMRVNEAAPDMPVVVLTHLDDAAMALGAVQAGAQDYLTKNELTAPLLERSIIYAVERKELVRRLQEKALAERTERELESLAALSPGTIVPADKDAGWDLRRHAPEVFTDLVQRYRGALDQQLEAGNPKHSTTRSDTLRALAERIGLFRAGPGTVVDVHLAGIGAVEGWKSDTLRRRYAEPGRLMVLELMGYLASYYRDFIESGGVAKK